MTLLYREEERELMNLCREEGGGTPRSPLDRGVPMVQVALAWLLRMPGVTAPIVGASKPHHIDEPAALEAHHVPHAVAGF